MMVNDPRPPHGPSHPPLRILAISRQNQGANDYAFVRAFRRAGHSVRVVDPAAYVPATWSTRPLRLARRALTGPTVRLFNEAVVSVAKEMRPHLFFVFKGQTLTADTVDRLRDLGTVAINFYPDTGLATQSRRLVKAIAHYDWVFTTKTFGVADFRTNHNVARVAHLDHAFDPEVHHPVPLNREEAAMYRCDVVFVGARTPKKEADVAALVSARPGLRYRIWGGTRWTLPAADAGGSVSIGGALWGLEYAKALRGAAIALGLLYEGDPDAPQGDVTTARTFEIPAAGAFMLHERTDEACALFAEGRECAYFGSHAELIDRVDYYLAAPSERAQLAEAGRARAVASGYSVDDRVRKILDATLQVAEERDLAHPART